MTAAAPRRDPNLDLLRAAAITAVVLGHLPVMSTVHHHGLILATWSGQFGVDLFFVLSGWLIGGLYFREHREQGRVRPVRFFARRAIRTMPPYFIALLLVWPLARWLKPSHPPFDLHYLLFLQNYFHPMPYFAVSWSLCIEEHFYLALPLLGAALRGPVDRAGGLIAAGLLVSPLCRTFLYDSPSIDVFDPSMLATHTHLDGLMLGIGSAWLAACHPTRWASWAAFCRRSWWGAALLLLTLNWIPPRLFYCLGYTFVSFLFAMLLAAWAGAAPLPGAAWTWTRRIALSSYSIYLTHASALQGARLIAHGYFQDAEIAYYGLALLLMGIAGTAFYLIVEKPVLAWRNRQLPASVSPVTVSHAA